MKTINYKQAGEPTMFITKDKQRVKQHGNQTVYLKDGEEFELELFNPTSKKVLAQITLNEKSLGNGIILRPGERIFLERYLDDAKKFIFETYNVDKNNKQVLNAIKANGKVSVRFHEEFANNVVWTSTWVNNPQPNIWYGDNTGQPLFEQPHITCEGSAFTTSEINEMFINYNTTYSTSANVSSILDGAPMVDKRETGRIEKGGHSSQEFDYDGTPFNSYPSWTDEWHILPFSEKLYVKEDLPAVYCTGCGAKRKKDTHKFCPICGTKY